MRLRQESIIKQIFVYFGMLIGFVMFLGLMGVAFVPSIRDIPRDVYNNLRIITVFEVKGNEIWMTGEINFRTQGQFVKLHKDNPSLDTLVETTIPGSMDDNAMIKFARYVRDNGFNTKLLADSHISSGGVDLYLSGVKRIAVKDGSKTPFIGVHSWSDGSGKAATEYPRGAQQHENNRKYVEDMLGSDEFYWFTLQAATADGIHQMSLFEIEKYGLVTEWE